MSFSHMSFSEVEGDGSKLEKVVTLTTDSNVQIGEVIVAGVPDVESNKILHRIDLW